jgi:hypothetical protein
MFDLQEMLGLWIMRDGCVMLGLSDARFFFVNSNSLCGSCKAN